MHTRWHRHSADVRDQSDEHGPPGHIDQRGGDGETAPPLPPLPLHHDHGGYGDIDPTEDAAFHADLAVTGTRSAAVRGWAVPGHGDHPTGLAAPSGDDGVEAEVDVYLRAAVSTGV